ncbi:MAG: peptidylprolyl isomerase [Dissulfurimicrobium hydrothermale]|uniref:peptidylprolyl isomerase n=1 Tax=Dissulfurimicrobium hydrothermale TaxID=1750598 RepID=UPI003C73A27E
MKRLQDAPFPLIAFFVTVLVLFFWTQDALCVVIDRVAAVVNGDVITLSELERYAEPILKKYMTSDIAQDEREGKKEEILKQVLAQLIDERLVEAEVKRLGIKVSDKEVDLAIDRICKENNMTLNDLKNKLSSDGIKWEDYSNDIKKRIENSQLVASQVHSKIVVTDEEVLSYIKRNGQGSSFENKGSGGDVFYVLEQVLISPRDPGDPRSKDEARKRAEEALDALKKGRNFEDVAQEYSYPPLDKAGVYLGTFAKRDMSKEIQDAVCKLKAGQFTGIINSPQGFQIVGVKEITKNPAGQIDKEKMETIREELYRKKLNARFEEWLNDLRSKATIKILL